MVTLTNYTSAQDVRVVVRHGCALYGARPRFCGRDPRHHLGSGRVAYVEANENKVMRAGIEQTLRFVVFGAMFIG
jgi:hypothetical protein